MGRVAHGHRYPRPMITPTREPQVVGVRVSVASDDPGATAAAYARLLDVPADDLRRGAAEVRVVGGTDDDHAVDLCVTDVDAAARLLDRRGLAPDLPLGVVAASPPAPTGDVTGLDHVVFWCTDRDQAAALFGATLGLDLRLDRQVADDTRQLFFRAGDVVVEVIVHDDGTPRPTVCVWGLAWHSPDLDVTHARLAAAAVDLSPIRTGRKPGTRIFTVKDPDLAIPTVVIGPELT